MQTLYLVRHGETEWNRAGRMQGSLDSPLTERGQGQARQVGLLLRDLIADPEACKLVVSPLGRARQTAGIIAEAMGIDAGRFAADPLVREVTWGDWNGMTREEIIASDPGHWQRFRDDHWNVAAPGGESWAEMSERARQWLGTPAAQGIVLVVSHGAFGRALRGRYLGLGPEETMALSEPQDAVFRLSQGTASRIDAPLEA